MSRQSHRLSSGGTIDRSHPVAFEFDGRKFAGYHGDTLASALVANGVKLVGRSFKYHRPRGILSAGPEEPNALMELRTGSRREPNTRATTTELYDGLVARSQNRWPSLSFDLMSVNSLLSPFISAGFYYKTFMWPPSFWERVYEPLIRRAAGLGRAAESPDPDRYERAYAFCDVLVIGAGVSGLVAALSAARSGAKVTICNEDFSLGGQLLSENRSIGGQSAREFLAQLEGELNAHPAIRVMKRTTVFGAYDGGIFGAVERVNDHVSEPPDFEPRQRYWRIAARRSILASGALERPIVFTNNDLPGIMLTGAVRTYINRFAAIPGHKAVVVANNDYAQSVVDDLQRAGIEITALIDPREQSKAHVATLPAGSLHFRGATVVGAHGINAVRAITVRLSDGRRTKIPCNLIAMSGGYNPSLHLATHLGGRPVWNSEISAFVPGAVQPDMKVAGSANGIFALAGCLADGKRAGKEAARELGFKGKDFPIPHVDAEATVISPIWRFRHNAKMAFVDFQNDVTDKDLELAEKEGFGAIEHAKRYTTAGMATDQGKTGNVNAMGIMSEITERNVSEIGLTTFRPPYTPVAIGVLAGSGRDKSFRPTRRTPSHDWSEEQGAVFTEVGLWLRPQYYPRRSDKSWRDACSREIDAVRSNVGIADISTLGKIDVQGPDAAEFLDRVYCNSLKTLPIGKSRYAVMLREDGFIFDDGTVSRLGERHYLVTTTTAHAAEVQRHFEFCHQVLWPELNLGCMAVSSQWAQFTIAGPKSLELLQQIIDKSDVSDLSYMACKEFTVLDGVEARVFRISFSGELAYEIAVPSNYGDAFVRVAMRRGQHLAISPYGLEAMDVMRIEKGHVTGNEINGKTTMYDLGLERMMRMEKDFVGRALSQREALLSPDRQRLTGFQSVDPTAMFAAGSHLFASLKTIVPENDEGYISSVGYSPSLGRTIGLGLLRGGPDRIGEVVRACDPLQGAETEVEICPPCFIDPQGIRLRG